MVYVHMYLAAVLCFVFVEAKFPQFFLESPGFFPHLNQLQWRDLILVQGYQTQSMLLLLSTHTIIVFCVGHMSLTVQTCSS